MTKRTEKPGEIQRLHEWLSSAGGNIALGTASIEAIEASKSGNKLTIVLKKPKLPKAAKLQDD